MSVPHIYGQELIDAILYHDHQAIEKILGDKTQVNVNFVDSTNQTPLCYAIQEELYEVVNKLLRMGANVNFNGEGKSRTPLQAAIQTKKTNLVQLLLDKRAQVNTSCDAPWSHLHEAVDMGSLSIVKLLVAKKANILFINKHGNSALDQAFVRQRTVKSRLGNLKIIQFLSTIGCTLLIIN